MQERKNRTVKGYDSNKVFFFLNVVWFVFFVVPKVSNTLNYVNATCIKGEKSAS